MAAVATASPDQSVDAGRSLRVLNDTSSPGLLESILGGIGQIFFGT